MQHQAYMVSTFNSKSDKNGEKYFSHYAKTFLDIDVEKKFPIVDFIFTDNPENAKIFYTLTEAQNICKMLQRNIATISTVKDEVCLTTYGVIVVNIDTLKNVILDQIGLIWSITS